MRKHHKYFIILMFVFLGTLSACSRVNQQNFQKIEIGMPEKIVIGIMGRPDEIVEGLTSDIYYWFDGATSYANAQKHANQGKKIAFISVMIGLPDQNNIAYVVTKEQGIVPPLEEKMRGYDYESSTTI